MCVCVCVCVCMCVCVVLLSMRHNRASRQTANNKPFPSVLREHRQKNTSQKASSDLNSGHNTNTERRRKRLPACVRSAMAYCCVIVSGCEHGDVMGSKHKTTAV